MCSESIQDFLLTINLYYFSEAIPTEESGRIVSQIPATPTPWLFFSLCRIAVITKPKSCSSLMDYSEYVTHIQQDGFKALIEVLSYHLKPASPAFEICTIRTTFEDNHLHTLTHSHLYNLILSLPKSHNTILFIHFFTKFCFNIFNQCNIITLQQPDNVCYN